MRRFVLTGAPGAGKTAIIRQLAAEGFATVPEAATDIIAREQANGIDAPWERDGFIAQIATLQEQRLAGATGAIQFYDRSPICTYALARHLDVPVPPVLTRLLDRIAAQKLFARRVFLIESLDFIENTAARRIGLDEARRFGALHAALYAELGYECVSVAPASVADRTAFVRGHAVT
ncbi:AAA family ATPase [Parasphingopyxis sp.]|uniref:AAA family ATPase n=1 Tax=Parasphingopyxis sp. TaxID=1920299 RepID=UPI0026136310|nr:AAA family ATPase [Parasphingopyxis sp.]